MGLPTCRVFAGSQGPVVRMKLFKVFFVFLLLGGDCGLCKTDDAKYIDDNCDWSCAKHRALWWARCDHLKMLSKSFSNMEDNIWEQCPSSTNAVERKNRDCKRDTPQCLKLAMMKVYIVDKVACLKHIAAEGIILSYRSRSEEAKRMTALKK